LRKTPGRKGAKIEPIKQIPLIASMTSDSGTGQGGGWDSENVYYIDPEVLRMLRIRKGTEL
jgi:hypothetical protein